jgi:hypothetical protein
VDVYDNLDGVLQVIATAIEATPRYTPLQAGTQFRAAIEDTRAWFGCHAS